MKLFNVIAAAVLLASPVQAQWQKGADPNIYDIELRNVHACNDPLTHQITVCLNYANDTTKNNQ